MVIYNHTDISMKYAYATLGRLIHSFFRLDGEYKYSIGTEVITYQKRNLRMDIAYFNSKNVINNIETQTKTVDEKKLADIAEYAKFLLINNKALVNSIVITKVNPEYCEKEIALTESLFLRPLYIYMGKEKILQLLNIITDKINSNQKLTYDESIALAILPTLAQDDIAEEITMKVCQLICQYEFLDETLKTDVCFVVEIMVDRNIKSKSNQKKFLEMLNMEEKDTFLQSFIKHEMKEELKLRKEELNEKYKKEIEAKKSELEAKESELEAKENELEAKESELEAKDTEILIMKKLLEEKKKQEEIDSIKQQLYKRDVELAEKDNFIIKTIMNNDNLDENTKKAILSSLLLI